MGVKLILSITEYDSTGRWLCIKNCLQFRVFWNKLIALDIDTDIPQTVPSLAHPGGRFVQGSQDLRPNWSSEFEPLSEYFLCRYATVEALAKRFVLPD
jgi:hypothetical protein